MLMLPPVTQSWTFGANNRVTFSSLNDTTARVLFGIKDFLVATMGYTVKYTCNGTTGPTSGSDHTDRWTTFSNATTRGAAAGNAQSFAVLTDGNGCDILLTYQGASDDVARISYSPTGVFTPAGTSNQQPTATDEQVMLATSLILATASLDRVWHVMATKDKKMFRAFVLRAGALANSFGVERVKATVAVSIAFSPAVVGWATSNSAFTTAGAGHVMGTGGANNGGFAKINSLNVTMGGAGEGYNASLASVPYALELQAGAAILVPVGFFTTTTNAVGKVGNRIDCWGVYANTNPAQGDTFGDLSHVVFGTGVHPWDGVTFPEIV